MELGYFLQSRVLDAANYGVAAHSQHLVLIATAPNRVAPNFPPATVRSPVALKDVISDLPPHNPKCRQTGKGFASSTGHVADRSQPFSWHCTGCYVPDLKSWDVNKTVAAWDQPLPGEA